MPQVDVEVAGPERRAVFENLMQLYVHDFSEQWFGLERGELDEDGRFPPYPLDPYWREADHVPLLVRSDGHLAGFALLNRASHVGETVDRNMAEFFIARKHRRGGVGGLAARTIYSRYPGLWETAVARRNVGALAFWRGVIGGHPEVRGLKETDQRTDVWDGALFQFRMG